MPKMLERGDWLTVGKMRCVVVDVFNTLPSQSACEVLSDRDQPVLKTAIRGHDGWRFLDAGRPVDLDGDLGDLINQLRAS